MFLFIIRHSVFTAIEICHKAFLIDWLYNLLDVYAI